MSGSHGGYIGTRGRATMPAEHRPGFRNILSPAPARGPLPDHLLAALALRLAQEPQAEHPRLPAGYTYLLQLIAHDCVFSDTPFWGELGSDAPAANTRLRRLNLDTILGGGPAQCPHAYAAPDRRALRLGRLRDGAARDIPRIGVDDRGLTDTLIADARNDDNALVSQLTVAFHLLHNTALKRAPRGADPAIAAHRMARGVYHAIILHDLLPRIMHAGVLGHYAQGGALLDPSTDEDMPVEFSHGAFRFAHAMVRHEYRVADDTPLPGAEALAFTSARGAQRMPMPASWVVRWSHFFDGLGPRAQRAMLIQPAYAPHLTAARFFPAIDHTGRAGLPYRDLASAEIAGAWDAGSLMQALLEAMPARDPRAAALREAGLVQAAPRAAALRAWLADPALDAVADAPPLPFFIMYEALKGGGETLGPLGSIILAETLFPALRGMADENAAALRSTPFAAIRTMAALIRLLARENGLRAAQPPFL